MMNWNEGYSASYYAAIVDPVTWRDIGRLEITGGSVSRAETGLRGAADIDMVDYDQGRERWLRIWLIARQGNDIAPVPLFTGLACSPSEKINGFLKTNTVQLYSVLKPADDVLLPRGWYAPAKANGGTLIKDLLSVTPAPVEVDDDAPVLTEAIIAEDRESCLTMTDRILTAMGWRMRISGGGTIRICPNASKASSTYDTQDNDSVEPEIEVEYDWYACPNVFRAVADDVSAVARDDDPDSMLSTASRGREIWKEETSCSLNDGESLEGYAKRRLKEEQRVSLKAKYRRRYDPDVAVGDLIQLQFPAQGLQGLYLVRSQSVDLGYGATTSEEITEHEE